MSDRIRLLREGIEPATQKGLEIGALNAPTVLPQEGDVRFVDRADDATLRDSHPLRLEGLVNVDYIWPGTGSLAAVIGTGELFDWAIASHVIEHVPNMLGWLRGIAEVLKPGGILNLAIPDCRFTFDVDSPRSTIGQVIESDLLGYRHPSIRQVFDYCFHAKAIEPTAIWRGEIDVASLPPFAGDNAAQVAHAHALNILHNCAYIDSHCWIVTPLSYVKILQGLTTIGVMPPLIPSRLVATEPGECEFFSCFRQADLAVAADVIRQEQLSALSAMRCELERQAWHGRLVAGM